MPIYKVQAPDGRILRLEGPEGASKDEILQAAAELYQPQPQPQPEEGFLRQAADVPVGIAQGAVRSVRNIADVFGADNIASKGLRSVEDYVGGLLSAQAKQDQREVARIMDEAKDKGIWDQVAAAWEGFKVAPVDLLSQGLGSVVPMLVGGAGAKAVGLGTAGIRQVAGGVGAAMGAGATKSAIYEAVKEELSNQNLPPEVIEQAAVKAQGYGENIDQIALGGLLGRLGAVTGVESALLPQMVGNISKKLASKGVGRFAQTTLAEAGMEGLQGGQEQVAQNIALQRMGVDVPTWRGVAGAGTLEAITGGALGAGVSAVTTGEQKAPPAPTAPPKTQAEIDALMAEQQSADYMRGVEQRELETRKQQEEAAQIKTAGELSTKVGEIGSEIGKVSLEAEGLDDSLNALYAAKDNLTVLKQNLDRVSANKDVRQQINEQLKAVNDKISEGQKLAKTIGIEPTRRAKLAKEEVGYIPEEQRAKASAAVFEGAAPEQVVMRELGPPQIAPAAAPVDLTIKPQELIDIGLPKSAAYTKQLSGLDLGDADQRTKAADIIGRAMQNPQVKPEVKEKLQNLYDSKLATPVPETQGALDFEAAPPAPAAPAAPTKIDDSVFDTLGIGKTAVLRKNEDLLNADLTKPEDRKYVRDVLEMYRDAPNRSDTIKDKIDTFLEQLPVEEAPVTEAPETVKLYRGVQKGKEAEPTSGGGLFMSPDRTVAENYAGDTGSVTESEVTFNNLLTAKNWVDAKAKLGLPKSTSMDKLIRAARDAGHDGLAFDTTNGREYVVLNPELVQTPEVTPEEGVQNAAPTPTEPAAIGQPSEPSVGVDNVGGVPTAPQEGAPGVTAAPESGGLVRPAERAGVDTQGIERAPAPVEDLHGTIRALEAEQLSLLDKRGRTPRAGTPKAARWDELGTQITELKRQLDRQEQAKRKAIPTEPSTTTSYDEALQRVADLQMGEEVDPKALARLARDAADSGLITQEDRRRVATEIAEGDVLSAAGSLEDALQKAKDRSVPNAASTLRATGNSAGALNDALSKAFTAKDPIAALQVIVNDDTGVFTEREQLVARRILDMKMPMPTMRMVDSLGNDAKGDPILGQYNSINDEIALVQGAADSHTFMHEMIHAFVHRTIVMQERGQARNPNFRTLQEVYDHVKATRPDLSKEYGLSSLTEFASEAMSNRDFQMQLMGMPYRNQSVFSWFARALRSLMGIPEGSPQGNVLFTAMVAVDGLMRSGRELQMRTTGKSILASDIAYAAQNVNTPLGKPLPTTLAEVNAAPSQAQRTELNKFVSNFTQGEENYTTIFRQQATDILAPVINKLNKLYESGIQNAMGNVNPGIWLRQAFDHQRLVGAIYRLGGIKLAPDGLWEATEVKDSNGRPASPLKIIEAISNLGKRSNTPYPTIKAKVATVLEGMRLKELRDYNSNIEIEAKKAAARGDINKAYDLRKEKKALHMSYAEIDALAAIYNATPEIQEIQRMMNVVRNHMVDAMVKSGRISKDKAEGYKAALQYVPFDRVQNILEKPDIAFAPGRKGIAALGKLPELEGSFERPVANTIDNYMRKIAWMAEQTMRNSAVVRTLNIMADNQMVKKLGIAESPSNEAMVVPTVYENGAPVRFEVKSPYDLAAFAQVQETSGDVMKLFEGASRTLRTGVTATPMFAVKQVLEDPFRVAFQSGVKHPIRAMARTLGGFAKLVTRNQVKWKSLIAADTLERLGMVGDVDYNPINPIETLEFDAKVRTRSPLRALVNSMEHITKASDMAARLAIYEQTMKESGNRTLAQTRAREFINFNRRGASRSMRALTRIVPFFNTWVQGLDLLYRGFSGVDAPSGLPRQEAARMFRKRMAIGFALGLAYAFAMSDDDGYKEASDDVRDRNIILPKYLSKPFGIDQSFKIPVPREIGFMVKSIPERLVQYLKDEKTGENKEAATHVYEFLKDAFGVYGNVPFPALVKPVIENWFNFSTLTNRQLISPGVMNRPAAMQYLPSTSEFAKALGEQTNISPIKIDNFIRGYFGLMGASFMMAMDPIINPSRPDRAVESLPFASIGLMAPIGSRTKDQFYEFREKVAQAVSGKNALEQQPDLQLRFMNENAHLLRVAPILNDRVRALEALRAQRKLLESGAQLGLTSAEKRAKIIEIQKIEVAMLQDIRYLRAQVMKLKE